MKQYLLDTNICVYFLNGKYSLEKKLDEAGFENCCVSEITIAELKYGVENSSQKERNRKVIEMFQEKFEALPIFPALDIYAKEKARLKSKGRTIDDFDLLIGATAINSGLTLITKNVKHFDQLNGILIEDWTLD